MSSVLVKRPQPRAKLLYVIIAAIAILTFAGVLAAAQILTSGTSLDGGGNDIGRAFKTSFGAVAVSHTENIGGPTSKALGGVTHGVGGLVTPDKMQVEVSTTITNLSDDTVSYNPAHFSLRDENGKEIRIAGSSIQPGTLQPDAAIDARLTFVAPRKDASFQLLFDDRGSGETVVIDLGEFNVGKVPADSGGHGGGHTNH